LGIGFVWAVDKSDLTGQIDALLNAIWVGASIRIDHLDPEQVQNLVHRLLQSVLFGGVDCFGILKTQVYARISPWI